MLSVAHYHGELTVQHPRKPGLARLVMALGSQRIRTCARVTPGTSSPGRSMSFVLSRPCHRIGYNFPRARPESMWIVSTYAFELFWLSWRSTNSSPHRDRGPMHAFFLFPVPSFLHVRRSQHRQVFPQAETSSLISDSSLRSAPRPGSAPTFGVSPAVSPVVRPFRMARTLSTMTASMPSLT